MGVCNSKGGNQEKKEQPGTKGPENYGKLESLL